MPTVFKSLSDGFYTAFFEPDPKKRKEKINAWIVESTPIIQSAVQNELLHSNKRLERKIVAGVAVIGPVSRLNDDRMHELKPQVKECGIRISQSMGFFAGIHSG